MKQITKTVIEALTSRGFSEAEAHQILTRVRSGKDEIPTTEPKVSAEFAKYIYERGFNDGVRHERDDALKRSQSQMDTERLRKYAYYLSQQYRQSQQSQQSSNMNNGPYNQFFYGI